MPARKAARKSKTRSSRSLHGGELARMQAAHGHTKDDAMLARIIALDDTRVQALLADAVADGWTLRGSDCWLEPRARRAMVAFQFAPPARASYVFDRSLILRVDLAGGRVDLIQALGDAMAGLLEQDEDEGESRAVAGTAADESAGGPGRRMRALGAKAATRRCRIVIRNGRPIVVCT
jgi:hypothetical protein